MLKRPWPGGADTPAGVGGEGAATTTTHSSGGGQSAGHGTSGTTNGVVPPKGNATTSHNDTGGSGGRTATSSSGGSGALDGSGKHTTDSSGQQARKPGTTIDLGEIEKARAIVRNLEKVGSKRKLNPNEQQAYDRARGLLERENSAQADVDSFRDDWGNPGERRQESEREMTAGLDSDFDSESKGSNQPNALGEKPYLTEYYNKVGRQKDNLDPLIKSIQSYSNSVKGTKDHLPIFVEEDNGKGASYGWKRDRAGRIIGHRITHGASTKKWEMLEEFAHYRVKQGWKKDEIKELRKKLRKISYGGRGEREGISEPAATAEEIIVKQHLLDHSSGLSEIERELLQNQIKQLYRYGLREGY